MRNKFISLVCAIAMVMSMFGAFNIASAADTQTISTKATLNADKTATFVVSYSGFTKVSSLQFKLPLDTDVFDLTDFNAKSATTLGDPFKVGSVTINYSTKNDTSNLILNWYAGDASEYANGEETIATIKVPVKDTSKLPLDVTLTEVAMGDETANGTISYGTADTKPNQTITVETAQLVDPNAPTPRPASPDRPAKKDEPAVEPTEAPVTEGQRIEGTATVKDNVATFVVNYAGFTKVSSLQFKLPLDTDVFDLTDFNAKSATTLGDPFKVGSVTINYSTKNDTSNLILNWYAGDASEYANGEETIATIKVPVKDTSKLPLDVTLTEVAMGDETANGTISYGTADTKPNQTIGLNAINVPNPDAVVVEPVKTVDLKDVVAKDAPEKVKEALDANNTVYITVDVKKGDSAAEYGKDYTASYKGQELSEEAYSNLISGYKDGVTMSEVLSGLTFNIYNNEVSSISTTVNAIDAEGNAEQIVDPKDNTLTPATPTAKPSEPSISVKASSTTVEFDKKFTVTATVKNAKDGAKVAFTTNDDEKYAVIFGTPTEINSKGETKATYVANDKAGTVTITATYTDTEGNEKSASVKVTVKKASTTTGGNDGTTSGGGPSIIAPGHTGAVTTPNTNTNYKPDFQDLDSVEWARTAINGLAMRGMISGRDQYTFDPNANITRAEYCQILMGAINALNAKGESTFADVPSTAWYYNAVSVASQLGIVSGYGDGNFGPNDLITRQDMALMTYKTAKIMNKSLEPVNAEITFEDSHEISDYAFEAVMTLQKAGIINGMTDTTFEPHSNATRAQSAKVIFDTFVDAQ